MQVEVLDVTTLPLFGQRLIEASAGTGKTYTLAVIYLRLLLGLGKQYAHRQRLTVEQILVVTFTEAATEELRNRIRDNIHQLRIACIRGQSSDPLYNQLLTEIDDLKSAASLLLLAERQMDEAAIYTIHGFCQRMLANNAFESGLLFEQKLVQDQSALYRQAVADYWRRYCYRLPLEIMAEILKWWSGPDSLLSDVLPFLQGDMPEIKQANGLQQQDIYHYHADVIDRINQIKQLWLQYSADINDLILASGVSKQSYSSRNLPKWLNSVSQWAMIETTDYNLPKGLDNFSQAVLISKTNKGEPPRHLLFESVETLLAHDLSLRNLVLYQAIFKVREYIEQEKYLRAELGFDDLLSRLDRALGQTHGDLLAEKIRQRYPVAMIDEFQDTDPQQYRIFQHIYAQQPETALLLIGDPKQAIYSFRGADIFTYIQAKQHVTAYYTMTTNWRSAKGLVESVNTIFQRMEQPFIFQQIPYPLVQAASKNHQRDFYCDNHKQSAIQIWHLPEEVNNQEYQRQLAYYCANQVHHWLISSQKQQAFFRDGQDKQAVKAQDIAILVRTGREARLIKEALNQFSIPSVYLSNRDNVFSTAEAQDMLWLLQAILSPEKERTLRTALACQLFALTASQLDTLNQDEQLWDNLVDEFSTYREYWFRQGVLPMLRELMKQRKIAENLLATQGGERRLTDFMHISELLQEASSELENEHALLRWLNQQIQQPDPNLEKQQLRLESDQHVVKIVTIHKSKGLEYPIVCLPFLCSYRATKQARYHDRDNLSAVIDLSREEQSLVLAEEERLAEDLRLLYVALTRAIYHCCIGIAPLSNFNRKSGTELHHSALGYLLQQGRRGGPELLSDVLDELALAGIAIKTVKMEQQQHWQPELNLTESLSARRFKRQIKDNWRVTSYSALQQSTHNPLLELLPRLDIDSLGEPFIDTGSLLSVNSFAKGAAAGTFLHSLLEPLDFSQSLDTEFILHTMQQHGIEQQWLPILQSWLVTILTTPLARQGICLKQLMPQNKQAELQFYLPIKAPLQPDRLDQLIRRYDPLSAQTSKLDFKQVEGMLKGFIDLIFCWQERYYIVDYKSNWLGENQQSYNQQALESAMISHRYDLQYQLYSLALHRFLRHRLPDYHYEQHFGGIYYLFLRGMCQEQSGSGVFACRPDFALIDGLDRLFKGEQT